MKMNWKSFLAMMFSVLLVIGVGSEAYAEGRYKSGLSDEEKEAVQQYDEVYLERQSESAELYYKLQEMVSNADAELYTIYGGSFIDTDGNLVILLTSMDERAIEVIHQLGEDIIVDECKHSFRELTDIMDTINAFKDGDDNFAKEFNHYMLVDSKNVIEVYLENLDERTIEEFRIKVSDSDAIEFLQSTDDGKDEANINAGAKISSGTSSASVGYRAKLNGVAGIVTAAHFVTSGDSVTYSGSVVGSCTASAYSGSVDAAFVKITNGTPTNTINGGSTTLSTTISEPGAGTVINKRGASTGSTSGTVYSTNASWTINGVNFTNLTSATYDSDSGDSGGIVYSYISSTGTRLTLGIHKGRKDGYAHYVKANQINSALGTTRY